MSLAGFPFGQVCRLAALWGERGQLSSRPARTRRCARTHPPAARANAPEAAPFIDLLLSPRTELRTAKQRALSDRVRDGLAEGSRCATLIRMATVDVQQATATLSQLLALVEAGEEVVISRAGKPVARLVAVEKPKPRREKRLGTARGMVHFEPGWDDPMTEEELALWYDAPLTATLPLSALLAPAKMSL